MGALSHLPTRDEIPQVFRWEIETVYGSTEAWEADFRRVQELLPTIQSYQGTLGQGAGQLLAALRLQDETGQLLERVYAYARMRRDENNRNNEAVSLHDRVHALATRIQSAMSYLQPEILALAPETLAAYFAAEPDLAPYRHYINELVREREHIRSAEVEAILARTGEVAAAPRQVFSMLTDADMRFGTVRDETGEELELTHGRFLLLMESQDRRVREDAFKALYGAYHQFRNTLAATLAASVKKDVFYAEVRDYESALHAALHPHNIPVEVYHNLVATVRRHLPSLHRYMGLRKRLLGVDELHMWDIYVPLVAEVDRKFPWDEASRLVTAALRPLGEDYAGVVAGGLNSRWVDVYETQGKTTGAYSMGTYTAHPFILMNYHEKLDDVFTLAHELGHALHSHYTREHQPFVYSHYTLFVAEVASTLNETLLTEHMLGGLSGPQAAAMQRYLVNHELETVRRTLFRQTMFAEFELKIHQLAEQGEALTADRLSAVYHQLNADYHGQQMVNDDEIAMEWARVPHFYRPFYVYQYATGLSAAMALARQILSEGRPAVERYLHFLRSGNSDYSINLLQAAGVDMATPAPVEQAMAHFDRRLAELEQLA